MNNPRWSGKSSRKIVKRIIIEGTLILLSPTHLGNGEDSDLTDMPLVLDPVDGKTPLLTGASIAGALRSALHANYPIPILNQDQEPTSLIFGSERSSEGEQSRLVVDDAYGVSAGVEYRANVRMNSESKTTQKDGLFNFQLWKTGTIFPLRFEMSIYENDDEKLIKQYLADALSELETEGRVSWGARKNSGFGLAKVIDWNVSEFDLTTSKGLRDWLLLNQVAHREKIEDPIHKLLGVEKPIDLRREIKINAKFIVRQSMLIQSGNDFEESGADKVQLKCKSLEGSLHPVLPGTSWRGVLHNQARKVYSILEFGKIGEQHLESLFGNEIVKGTQPKASRIRIHESVIPGKSDLIQSRVRIDPFTGGAKATALFFDQPVFTDENSTIELIIRIKKATVPDLSLAMYLIKDLWNGDVSFGGENSVGRGRLSGVSASIDFCDGTITRKIEIENDPKEKDKLTLNAETDDDISFFSKLSLSDPEGNIDGYLV